MAHDDRDILEILRFELKFLEDGGYGRSPHSPWRAPAIFEDSPACPNFCDPARPHACEAACWSSLYRPADGRKHPLPLHSAYPRRADGGRFVSHRKPGRNGRRSAASGCARRFKKIERERGITAEEGVA